MIYQTTPGIIQIWYDKGCYCHCIVYEAVRRCAKELVASVDWIHRLYESWVANGVITKECYVLDPVAAFNSLGLNVKSVRKEGPDYECRSNEIEINHWYYAPKDWHHFVNGDGYGRTTNDPWGISTTATEGILKNKRIFTL